MKPFLFSHAEREASGARELSLAELEIVVGAELQMADHTQVMTADPAGGGVVVRDGYDG